MKIDRAIKVRIYPNKKQQSFLERSFGCCRFLYNQMLAERKKVYHTFKDDEAPLHTYQYKTEREYKLEYPFLTEVDAKALQTEWRHLRAAFQHFFRGRKRTHAIGFPKFKSKKDKQSYTTFNINTNCKIDFPRKRLKLPKLHSWIKFRDDRCFSEQIKQITISKNKTGKFFASILINKELTLSATERLFEEKIIAFDMSAQHFLITKGCKLISPRFYRKEEQKLKRLHKQVSHKKQGSNNRRKARVRLATVYETITNRRHDFLHKLTSGIAEHFDCVILEDLSIKGLQQFSSGLSKSISLDFSWYEFVRLLRYKLEERGKHLILINRFFPSSKTCSVCRHVHQELCLHDRFWCCPVCHTQHDRDVNASINLRHEGKRLLTEAGVEVVSSASLSGALESLVVGTTMTAFREEVSLIYQHSFMKKESICFS